MPAPDFHHNVYVILLDDAVAEHSSVRRLNPDRDPAKPCVYVGMTGLREEQRFDRHRTGTQSGRFVEKHGVRLRLDLVEGFSRLPFSVAAWMEPKLAAWLRAQGFGVWQN